MCCPSPLLFDTTFQLMNEWNSAKSDILKHRGSAQDGRKIDSVSLYQKNKSLLYSKHYAEAYNEWRDQSPRLITAPTKRRNGGEPLRRCVRFDLPERTGRLLVSKLA